MPIISAQGLTMQFGAHRALDALDVEGARARQAGRLGFLEWAFGLDDLMGAPEAARDALDNAPAAPCPSPAARAFLDYLGEAADAPVASGLRRGGRRRVLKRRLN